MANIVTRIDNQLQVNGGKALDAKMQPVETLEALNNALTDSTNKTGPFYRTNVYIGMVVVVTNPVYEYDEDEDENVLVSTDPKEYIYTENGWVEKKAGVDSTEDIKKLQEAVAAESTARTGADEAFAEDIAALKEQMTNAYIGINTNASGITELSEMINNLPQGQTVYFSEEIYQFTNKAGEKEYTTNKEEAETNKAEGTEITEIAAGAYIVGGDTETVVLEKLVTNETTIQVSGEDVE